jgi:polysaccharide export outer membrane protein
MSQVRGRNFGVLGMAGALGALGALFLAPPGASAADDPRSTTKESPELAYVIAPANVDLSTTTQEASELGYVIGPEDVLQISVWRNDAVSRVVPVRPDGMISLPLINDVQASGRTPNQLRDQLTKRLAEYIPSPEVSVIVTEVKSFKVSVMGQVMRPGRYELKSRTTVVDVLAMAGGFAEFASRSKVAILRRDGPGLTRIAFNYDKLGSEDSQGNLYVLPGDIVLVP